MKLHRWELPSTLIALDGEGIDNEDHSHDYRLLCASDGKKRWIIECQDRTLSTDECFTFLMNLPDATYIGFSILYDLNMMVKQVFQTVEDTAEFRDLLWAFNHSQWITLGDWKIKSFPRKIFELIHTPSGKHIRIEDVFAFFQRAFVFTLNEWKVGDPELIEVIRLMKNARGNLQEKPWHEVVWYCLKECDLLVDLYWRLLRAFDGARNKTSVPIGLCGNYGPGAAASYTLGWLDINKYKQDFDPVIEDRWIKRCYYGGRFDLAEAGYHETLHQYDINSAYPYHASKLPCLRHGKWRYAPSYEPNAKIAMWKVRWHLPFDFRWPPFPWRNRTGAIYYPIAGYGTYWASEVTAGLSLVKAHVKQFNDRVLRIEDGMVYETKCQCRPFDFIKEMYEIRKEMVADPYDPAERAMKLVYNSIYGKLAQMIMRANNEFQCFAWAGMITAGTRAQLLNALEIGYHDIVSVATDGILSRVLLPLPGSKEKVLGEWEYKLKGRTWIIMPGIYWFPDGKETDSRTRGHEAKSIDWPKLCYLWEYCYADGTKEQLQFKYTTKRFIGAGAASQRTDAKNVWCTWQVQELVVNFHPKRRHFQPLATILPGSNPRISAHFKRNMRQFQKTGRVFWYPTIEVPGANPEDTLSARYRKGSSNAERYEEDTASDNEQPVLSKWQV